jgi:hypothetical protein
MFSIQYTNNERTDLVDTRIFSTPPECSSLASSSRCPSWADSSDSSSCSSTSFVEEEDEEENEDVISATEVDDDSDDIYDSDEENAGLKETCSNAFSLPSFKDDEGEIVPKTRRTHFAYLLSPLGLAPIEEEDEDEEEEAEYDKEEAEDYKEHVVKLQENPESFLQIENSLCCGTFYYEEEESDDSNTTEVLGDDSDNIYDTDEEDACLTETSLKAFSLPFKGDEGRIVPETSRTHFVSLLSPLSFAPIEGEEAECDEEEAEDYKEPVVKLQENPESLHRTESTTPSSPRSVVHVGGGLKTRSPVISSMTSEKICSTPYLAPTKDSLAWFQAKREKWRSSSRPKLLKLSDLVVPDVVVL